MKLRTHWILILIIFIALSLGSWTQQGNSSSNPQWEYKVLSIDNSIHSPTLEKALNELGAQGWELLQYQQAGDRYLFKRQK